MGAFCHEFLIWNSQNDNEELVKKTKFFVEVGEKRMMMIGGDIKK